MYIIQLLLISGAISVALHLQTAIFTSKNFVIN